MAVYGALSMSLQAETGMSNIGYVGVNGHVSERRAYITSPAMYPTATPTTMQQAAAPTMYPALHIISIRGVL
ncbi:hypothetical protein M422DRAFT_249615 [Sphaerobolus stellatus SS14]|uniref:Uncharacterized protein n=1 Tax=Sphaerobolus stellatus (strain SS14) TaxID=990650 RepID=A0A0C9W3X6_SPHS4|nr:hypothetical protein M422DRAFT_249615 [Sphaerobolus stellatus SS14]